MKSSSAFESMEPNQSNTPGNCSSKSQNECSHCSKMAFELEKLRDSVLEREERLFSAISQKMMAVHSLEYKMEQLFNMFTV